MLEASRDGRAWQPYEWKYKLNAGGHGVALWLHLPRLDWRVWFLPLAAKRGYTCAELAVGWVLRNPEVSVALVGAKNTEQVLLNARYMTDFTEAELAEIEEILDGTPDVGFQGETSEETRAAMAAQG